MFERLKHMPLANRLLRRPPFFYRAAGRQLAGMDKMNLEQRAAFQARRLDKVLAAARNLKGYAGGHGALADWPLLAKAQMAGHESDFIAPTALPLVPAATGGTTGQPLRVARTWQNIAAEQAVVDHLCALGGVDARTARVAVLRGDSIKPASDMNAPFWIDEGPARRIFSAHHLNRATILHFKAALRSFEPQILFCYPSSLANLLALIGEDRNVRIPLVFASSEMLSPETVTLARETLGANVIDFYGHAERIACAYALNGGGYRFLPGYGHIELIPSGEGLARLVATSLSPQGQLFVRYDTGDLVRVPSHDPQALQAIALGVMPFDGVEGRDSEFVDLPDGRRIIGLNHIPRGVSGAVSIQLYRSAPRQVGIYIVAGETFDAASLETIMANFRQKFPAGVDALPVFVERPVRERNGKAPLLLRSPDPASIVLSTEHSNTCLEYVA